MNEQEIRDDEGQKIQNQRAANTPVDPQKPVIDHGNFATAGEPKSRIGDTTSLKRALVILNQKIQSLRSGDTKFSDSGRKLVDQISAESEALTRIDDHLEVGGRADKYRPGPEPHKVTN